MSGMKRLAAAAAIAALAIPAGAVAQSAGSSGMAGYQSGYGGARPVRIGNAAYQQRQNDVYGALLDAAYIHSMTREGLAEEIWPLIREQVEGAMNCWRDPDQGIWEARGEPQHYTSSKLMAWVAFDRALRMHAMHESGATEEQAGRWRAVRYEIHAEVCAQGFDPELNSFVQSYGSKALDASLLLIAKDV